MSDDYLHDLGVTPHIDTAEVHYTYTPAEQEARKRLLELIEAERRDFLARVEPYVQQLGQIKGTPFFIIKTGLR
jgi:hypothetical protein